MSRSSSVGGARSGASRVYSLLNSRGSDCRHRPVASSKAAHKGGLLRMSGAGLTHYGRTCWVLDGLVDLKSRWGMVE